MYSFSEFWDLNINITVSELQTKIQIYIYIRDGTRSRGMCLVRSDWSRVIDMSCSVYIRAAPLIVKKLRSRFKHPRNLFPEWRQFSCDSMSIATRSHGECQWSVRSTFCSCPCVHVVIYWYGRRQNMRCSSSTDAGDVKQELKTFKSAFMLLLVQKEQHKRSFQPHIIISVLQTFKWQEY